jgi:hypothetical protein
MLYEEFINSIENHAFSAGRKVKQNAEKQIGANKMHIKPNRNTKRSQTSLKELSKGEEKETYEHVLRKF